MSIKGVCTLYGIEAVYNIGRIAEYEVIKETEKTYIVKNPAENIWRGTDIIRKATMQNRTTVFAETHAEAVSIAKEVIKKRIERNTERIEALKNENIGLEKYFNNLREGEK